MQLSVIPASVEACLVERASSLPDERLRLVEVLSVWNLRAVDLFTGGYNSLVLRVESEGGPAVLKLASIPASVTAEAAALRWWGEEVAPAVLRQDEQLGALLIELLLPGTLLPWDGVADSEPMLPLLRRMQHDADQTLSLPLLSELAHRTLTTMQKNTAKKRELVDEELARQAENLLGQLFSSADSYGQVVLHGDAVPANVLRARNGPRVIDPRACIGEAAYDAAYWSVFSGYGRDARENVTLLADELGLDEQRMLRWAWALAINRLLQIADSPYPGHAHLCDSLRDFIAAAHLDIRDT